MCFSKYFNKKAIEVVSQKAKELTIDEAIKQEIIKDTDTALSELQKMRTANNQIKKDTFVLVKAKLVKKLDSGINLYELNMLSNGQFIRYVESSGWLHLVENIKEAGYKDGVRYILSSYEDTECKI